MSRHGFPGETKGRFPKTEGGRLTLLVSILVLAILIAAALIPGGHVVLIGVGILAGAVVALGVILFLSIMAFSTGLAVHFWVKTGRFTSPWIHGPWGAWAEGPPDYEYRKDQS